MNEAIRVLIVIGTVLGTLQLVVQPNFHIYQLDMLKMYWKFFSNFAFEQVLRLI